MLELGQRGVKGVTAQHYRFKIPALERFENKFYIWIDAELNGLQTDEKIFLIFDLWLVHLVGLLKKKDVLYDRKHNIWTFFILKWNERKNVRCIVCRAGWALSIGIRFNLNRENIFRKKLINILWGYAKLGKKLCKYPILGFNYFSSRTFWNNV